MISIILYGACGHMGRVAADVASRDPDVKIVAGIDGYGETYDGFPVYRSLDECAIKADVIVDFSTASAIDPLVAWGVERNIPMVICTTGLSEHQLKNIEEASKETAILRSSNMSLGINLLMKLLRIASKTLCDNGFDPEVMEMHHRRKLDAPSGTAIMLADSINEGIGGGYSLTYDRSERRESRPVKEIGMSSLRGGTVVGVHDVFFAGEDEVIELKHTAYSRAIFAKGALAAAKFLAGTAPGLYSMEDVIG